MASVRGILNIQSLNELTYENVPTLHVHQHGYRLQATAVCKLPGYARSSLDPTH